MACGFSGHGIQQGPAVGRALAGDQDYSMSPSYSSINNFFITVYSWTKVSEMAKPFAVFEYKHGCNC
jgi:hypothetical protein